MGHVNGNGVGGALCAQLSHQELGRFNIISARPPTPLTVVCSICKQRLWTDLQSYALYEPSQPHITAELYTNLEYDKDALVENNVHGDPRKLSCQSQCFGPRWLVDNDSGDINLYGWKYGVALGPDLAWYASADGIDDSLGLLTLSEPEPTAVDPDDVWFS
eukprot:NODE_8017_length_728_cov_103.378512_g7765_i0.p2 GENE.NODE_8017_length_728_cov_103.378512_g7765_i0~~NODE_8017_length_728_cov_103.378512_g7765_i0.p2  ORF type:complete len:161 (+),score=4.90 NODE_8017_length_728_cov_103.378512_g7765_i0:201-683(+)